MPDYRLASLALEDFAERLGVSILKALNPLDPEDFVVISGRLAKALKGATKGEEAAALKKAIDTLDVDWPNLSAAGRKKIIAAARAEVGAAVSAANTAERVLEKQKIDRATKATAVKRYGFDITPRLTRPDETAAQLLRRSQMVYIKDEYGRRADAFDKQAKYIVATGLEKGLSKVDIAEDLSSKLSEYQINRSNAYWTLIADDFAVKSRTMTQINTFASAGVVRYRFVVVRDERLCPVCSSWDGKTWSVKTVKKQLEAALDLDDPEDIRDARPWVRHRPQEDGSQKIFFERNGRRRTVGTVAGGVFQQDMDDDAMLRAGITSPPLHGKCRCDIVPN